MKKKAALAIGPRKHLVARTPALEARVCFAAGLLVPTPQGGRENAPEAPVTEPRAQGALNMWTSFHSIITYYQAFFKTRMSRVH